MDETDKRILKILESNARTSLSELSRQVNLSIPAVGGRLRKLERSGVIAGYTTIPGEEQARKKLGFICLLTLKNHDGIDTLKTFLREHPDIQESHFITGDFEIMLKISADTIEALESILVTLRSDYSVSKTKTYTIFSTISA